MMDAKQRAPHGPAPADATDDQGREAAGNAPETSPGEEMAGERRGAGTAPGSLMSVKIRRRQPAPPARHGAPATPKEISRPDVVDAAPAPPQPPVAQPATRVEAPAQPAPEPTSRVVRRVQQAERRDAAGGPARGVAQTPAPSPGRSGDRAGSRDMVAYWTQLRGARRYPQSRDLDAERVAAIWPNSILIRCRPGSRVLEPERVFAGKDAPGTALGGLRGNPRLNLSPLMLQWLLGLAGEVVREGRPMEDRENFPAIKHAIRYRAIAMPFSDDERAIDHVLCHVMSEK